MTTKWWKAGQCLLVGSLLMFAAMAAGGEFAQLPDGTTGPVTLDSGGTVVFHFAAPGLTDADTDEIRIVISGDSGDAGNAQITVSADGETWDRPLADFGYSPLYTCVSEIGIDEAGNVDFGVWYPLASIYDGGLGWASVTYVKIENPTDSAIVISRVEASPFGASPVITRISIEPAALRSATSVEAYFTDKDGGDHTAKIDWGDGTETGPSQVNGGPVTGSHIYASTGVYTVKITVTDSDGGTGSDTAYAPVYDPDAWSLVTGAGWYPEEGGPCGKAFFGFVCRQRAGHTPQGEMRLRWGQNRFEATCYEWLVVTDEENTAWFAGTGTINGQGSYDFFVEVADPENKIWIVIGDQYDNNGPLSINGGRIKIRCWD